MAHDGSQTSPEASGEIPPNPRGLKAAVIIMGVLLVAGFFAVFVTIIYRVVSPGDASEAQAPRGVYGEVDVSVPEGSEIVSTVISEDRALVRLRRPDGAQSLVVFDIRRGHELGRFNLVTP